LVLNKDEIFLKKISKKIWWIQKLVVPLHSLEGWNSTQRQNKINNASLAQLARARDL
jgi:hypothetical protein